MQNSSIISHYIFVKGTINEREFNMNLPFINKFILKMERDEADSTEDMVVYNIVGGDLAHSNDGGNARFEFRRIRKTPMRVLLLYKNMNLHYLG